MKKYLLTFIALIFTIGLALILNACATIFSGSTQKVNVDSDPPGAKVYVDGRDTYQTTPCRVYVKRKAPNNNQHIYSLEKNGYEEYVYRDDASVNFVTFGNLIFGGLIGIGIDWLTGSIYKYDKEVMAILNPEEDYHAEKETADKSGQIPERMNTTVQKDTRSVTESIEKEETLVSDIDKNIPKISKKYPYRFALIIGNEDYSSYQLSLTHEVDVEFARNDARAFKKYANNTLGIPERNIVFLTDATRGQMSQAIAKMNLLAKNAYGKAEIFFYYAGHGLPHEVSQEPYLMPVDVSGKDIASAIKLKDIYEKLTEYSSRRVTVFLDACFSGGARDQGLLAARGVKIEPKKEHLKGNLVVFTASSGIQSALPYREKRHGFFTYYLLKKFQSTEGNLTYKELSDYLKEKVGLESVLLNDKEQNPQVNVSASLSDEWQKWEFND